MIQRNKGDTPKIEDSIRITKSQAILWKDSILRLLEGVEVGEGDRVQLEDIKNIYALLECITK